jgi:hypothetical protein
MSEAVVPLPHVPSWHAQGQLSVFCVSTLSYASFGQTLAMLGDLCISPGFSLILISDALLVKGAFGQVLCSDEH